MISDLYANQIEQDQFYSASSNLSFSLWRFGLTESQEATPEGL